MGKFTINIPENADVEVYLHDLGLSILTNRIDNNKAVKEQDALRHFSGRVVRIMSVSEHSGGDAFSILVASKSLSDKDVEALCTGKEVQNTPKTQKKSKQTTAHIYTNKCVLVMPFTFIKSVYNSNRMIVTITSATNISAISLDGSEIKLGDFIIYDEVEGTYEIANVSKILRS